jgi:hypothetical protein
VQRADEAVQHIQARQAQEAEADDNQRREHYQANEQHRREDAAPRPTAVSPRSNHNYAWCHRHRSPATSRVVRTLMR